MRPRRARRSAAAIIANPAFAGVLALGWGAAAVPAQPREIRCPCIADTTLSTVPPRGPLSSGGGLDRIATESNRRFVLLKFDMRQLADVQVTRAVLRLRRVEHLLVRAAVSTVAGDWREGSSAEFAPEPGAACFRFATYAEDERYVKWWGAAGSDVSDVVFGGGGSRWAAVVPAFDKDTLWYEIDVPPALVQAVAQGLQPGGFCLSDDFGRADTAPTFWSRESTSPPELVVYGERVAQPASAAPVNVRALRDALGLEWVEFEAPQALGFEVLLSDQPLAADAGMATAKTVDLWAMPAPGAGPRRALISFHRSAADRFVAVRAIEAASAWSRLAPAALPDAIQSSPQLPDVRLERHPLPEPIDRPFTMHDGPVLSEDGRWIRTEASTWWKPFEGPIALEAGRNEFVAFQVVLAGGPGDYAVLLGDWQSPAAAAPAPRATLFRQHYVRSRLGQEKFAPDALLPLANGERLTLDLLTPAAATQPSSEPTRRRVAQAVWVELHVPHGTPTGVWRTRVVALRDGAALLDIPVELSVVAPTLPDTLQFTVCLDARQPPAQRAGLEEDSTAAWTLLEANHRLAHAHRTTLAVLPYAPLGRMHPGFAPRIAFDGGAVQLDWSDWDARFARYFDGGAFRDLPRAGVPVALFYLPFHEAWPLPFAPQKADPRARLAEKYHYRTTWTERLSARHSSPRPAEYLVWPVERAFPTEYVARTKATAAAAAAHLAGRGGATQFQIALHNRAGDAAGSGWWHFNPPYVHDDVLALRYWLRMYREGLAAAGAGTASGPAAPRITVRAGCSHPLVQRDLLDGLPDVTLLGPGLAEKLPSIAARPERFGSPWSTAEEMSPELGWAAVYKWVWGAVLGGARGVHVPDSLGAAGSWENADDAALLYPAPVVAGLAEGVPPAGAAGREPLPSLRLKALCRAQQDVEWLEAWIAAEQARGTPRGYALAIAGQALLERTRARVPNWTTVLPVVRFPGELDTVALEELRRVLRAAR